MRDFGTNIELATILESITDAFFALDHQWHFTYLNSEAERILERKKEELLGRNVWEEFPEAVDTIFYREYHRAVEEQESVTFETFYLPLDVWVEVKAYPSEAGLTVYFRDVSQRKRAEEELRRSEERLRAVLVQYGGDLIAIVEADGTIRYASPAVEAALGYEPEALVGTNVFDTIHPQSYAETRKRFSEDLQTPGQSPPLELRVRHADGSWRDFEATGNNLLGDPDVRGVVIHAHDITGRKRTERLLGERSEAIEASVDGVAIIELDGGYTYVNQAHASMYGYDRPEELLGESWRVLYDEDQTRWMERHAMPGLEKTGYWRGEAIGKRRDGTTFEQELSLTAIDGRRVVCVVRDITGRKALERQLEYQAFHDMLTDLPNRALFEDRLRHALDRIDRQEEHIALLFMDLDDFKVINDSLGHLVGDRLLVAVARRLENALRSEDTVARFSGDEFMILLEGDRRAGEAAPVAGRIIEALREPFDLGNEEVSTTASIGICYGISGRDRMEELLRRADVAMYEAKSAGRGRYRTFEPEMGVRAEERQALGSALRRTLAGEELVLHYQPKIEIETGEIIGAEALVRWNHPERGLMLPAGFVPLAEETGMILPIGRWVFREACRRAKAWHERHPKDPPLLVCVNVSAREFQNPELVREIAESLRETGVDPACMELEITESTLMSYEEDAFSKLGEIRDLGVNLAIDDFGTGYSSLSYLRRLPVNYLKIDRSFVSELGTSPESNALLSTIIDLAQSLNMKTVAEGVETEAQLSWLKEMGCDVAQGYYFARPQPGDEFSKFLAEHYGL